MSDRARDNVLVACVGNIFFGDDGFGVEVARELDARDLPDRVVVVDYGIRGLDLAYALLEPWCAVVVVDAIARGGNPGDLYLLEIEPDADADEGIDPHSMDPYRVLALARSLGDITAPVFVVGCEPASFGDQFEGHMGLSDAVAVAIPEAARMVEWLIQQHLPMEATAAPQTSFPNGSTEEA
jgi:hydrogenase maturation protease